MLSRRNQCARDDNAATSARQDDRFKAGRLALAGALCLAVAACTPDPEIGDIGFVEEGFAGIVAADEPNAVRIGVEVLTRGGTAADAAVAMSFGLAVTLPSRASLSAGGACLHFYQPDKGAESIVFPANGTASGGVVPLMPRAMAVLHASGGSVRWEELVAPAENMARSGHRASRALLLDLEAAVARGMRPNQEFSDIFLPGGRRLSEGDKLTQGELAGVLGGIRLQGAGYLHGGSFPERYADALSQIGIPLTPAEVRDAFPDRQKPAPSAALGDHRLYLPQPPSVSGVMSGQIASMLLEEGYASAGSGERAHLLAEASLRAVSARTAWLSAGGGSGDPLENLLAESRAQQMIDGYRGNQNTPAASLSPPPRRLPLDIDGTGFVVGDRYGNAVACAFSMNNLFGIGLTAAGTGIVVAPPPSPENGGGLPYPVALVGNENTGRLSFAIAASGGPAAPANIARIVIEVFEAEEPLDAAVAAPRLVHVGQPDGVAHEPGLAEDQRAALRERGHQLGESSGFGRVNAFYCPRGLRDDTERCEANTDPRGAGLSVRVQ
ncbi:MAG: gamma-glutamyltransferase [Rhodovibrionaceae bacterium]